MNVNDQFREELKKTLFNVIDRVTFKGMKTTLYFKSGNIICAISPNETQLRIMKEEMIKNLGSDKVEYL